MGRIIIPPSGVITFYKNINIRAGAQYIFRTKEEQAAFFAKRECFKLVNYSYITNGAIRVEKRLEELKNYKYFSFINGNIDSTKYYAKILKINYVNNATTEIIYEIDYFQTFLFDFKIDNCFIEREHLSASEYTKAVANPYRGDIAKLITQESMAASKVDEVDYEKLKPGMNYSGCFKTLNRYDDMITVLKFTPPVYAFLPRPISPDDYATYGERISNFDNLFKIERKGGMDFTRPFGFITPKTIEGVINYNWFAWEKMDSHEGFINEILTKFAEWGMSSSIISIKYMPADLLAYDDENENLTHKCFNEVEGEKYGVFINADDVKNKKMDPKLSRFPFQYIRVVSPDSNVKELQYEHCWSLAQGQKTHIQAIPSILGDGGTAVGVYNYAHQGVAQTPKDAHGINSQEIMVFRDYPQVPYMIDAYASYIASKNASVLMNTTKVDETMQGIAHDRAQYNLVKSEVQGAAAAVGFIGSVVSGNLGGAIASGGALINAGENINTQLQNKRVDDAQKDLENEALKTYASGKAITNSVYSNAKKAINANEYHEGAPEFYSLIFKNLFFKVYFVKLKDSILKQYDRVLKEYGYKTDLFATPLIYSYLHGGEAPHFETIDGEKITYCQTLDAKISAPYPDAEAYIKNLFDKGCKFIDAKVLQ